MTHALATRRELAVSIAAEAADLLMRFRGRLTDVAWKGAHDLVTEADRASEAFILNALSMAFPDDRIIGEEGGGAGPDLAHFVWFVDPLDGTTNFVHGLPHFAVSLGLAFRTDTGLVPVAGAIVAPALLAPAAERPGITWDAASGQGARKNGAPIAVSHHLTLDRALIATGFPYDHAATAPALVRPLTEVLSRCLCIRRLGSASLDLAHVADGTFGGYWEPRLKPWDLAAGVAIVREAGGRVTDHRGTDTFLETGDILATNGHLHPLFLDIL
jgi:myo-inositol-1(or 4)-monophosphatase